MPAVEQTHLARCRKGNREWPAGKLSHQGRDGRVGAQRVDQFARELQTQREKRERVQLQDAEIAKRKRRLEAVKEKTIALTEAKGGLAGALVVTLPDTGHAMMAEQPDAVLDALRRFL